QALAENQALMARHVIALAGKIIATRPHGITLVSLARAGTPVGVLLKRVFEQQFNVDVEHYSISIIRDIGIDTNALLHILERHDPKSLVIVDGWTGKGVISKQLEVSLAEFFQHHRIRVRPELYVLADLCGTAYISASREDYLIPSSILNSTVSGLVSRSVIDKKQLSESDFHGCFYYKDYLEYDLSCEFVDSIMIKVNDIMRSEPLSVNLSEPVEALHKQELRHTSKKFLAWISENYNIVNPNLIKPGIGESTRVLLRREADLLLIRERNDDAVRHLIYLAEHKKVEIHYYPNLPYRATALIKEH
ncbi:cysteine protease StiP domain-containing protein, partial [Methylicorpusculum sp.]|uniref:cysteine protease StiP domain-containing protein n=1 Tax=Methylicorpusculum sp. TaxID=2713644 RepID=UPI002ABAD704